MSDKHTEIECQSPVGKSWVFCFYNIFLSEIKDLLFKKKI